MDLKQAEIDEWNDCEGQGTWTIVPHPRVLLAIERKHITLAIAVQECTDNALDAGAACRASKKWHVWGDTTSQALTCSRSASMEGASRKRPCSFAVRAGQHVARKR